MIGKSGKAAGKGHAHGGEWTFLTNHAHVLLCIADNPSSRIRELAERVGITERAVQGIIVDLESEGYIAHERQGRRNRYEVSPARPMRHPVERHRRISALMELVRGESGERRTFKMDKPRRNREVKRTP